MALFNGKADRKMIGILVSPKRYTYLSLFTLAKGVTKASLYRGIMDDWIDEQQKRENETELLKQLLHRAQTQYNILKRRRPNYSLDAYKTEIETDLVNKGLADEYIAIILQELK